MHMAGYRALKGIKKSEIGHPYDNEYELGY